ncbi:MAG: DMT family transporter [Desulfuromonadaceae bacterium]|nr:DMT family transporter [Desulfuromonadaceae bacterium]
MNNMVLVLLLACGGLAVAIQPSINARLAERVGSYESSLISFAVGTLAMLVMVIISGRGNLLRNVVGVSWWELTGGFLGAYFVTMTIIAVPRLGTAAVMSIIISGQLITGVLLDQFGAFGLRQIPLTPVRGIGILLLCLGTGLVMRR